MYKNTDKVQNIWLYRRDVVVYKGFEDDSLFYRKQVKKFQGWNNTSTSGSTSNKGCQRILYILEPCDIFGCKL